MGSVDVVPGVSGGTMALILGIYEELIGSIRAVGRFGFWHSLLRLRIAPALQAINLAFLLAVGSGIGLAIVTLARGLEWLLIHQPVLIWSFFFGLVLGSVITVAGRIRRWGPALWAALAAGAIGAYWLVGQVPLHTPNAWWFLILSGAVASCAMILPGISGAFILVLLGKYQVVLSAVNQRDFVTVGLVAAGAVIGLVSFAQLLGWLFRRYHDLTIALLTGLMLGSLRKVWPWKVVLESVVDGHGELLPVVERNELPSLMVQGAVNPEVLFAALLVVAGFAAVVLIERWAKGPA